ncbi:putative AfsR-family transcriptional regulator [Alicycliphilus sp. B1]|nr:putative AfsR-family transcriptional regulator [Alicycliphilus sp. B1]
MTGTEAWAWELVDATSTQVNASAAQLNGAFGIGVGAGGSAGAVGAVVGCDGLDEDVVDEDDATGLKVIDVDAAFVVIGDIASAANSPPLLPPPQPDKVARTSRPDNGWW